MPVPVPETPLEVPVNTRPSPEVLDTLAYEVVEEHQPSFIRGNYGMANPDDGDPLASPQGYEGFQLVKEETVAHDKVKRWWYNGAVNQDTYNYAIDYVFDSAAHPLFQRRYIVRRDLYVEIARESPLTGVWMVVVTNGGAPGEYAPASPPAVTIAGDGAGATATALVKPDGTIGWVYITAEGTGYTAATAAIPGTATATATVQATSCVLISQKVVPLPDSDPRASLYVLEVRAYQTFPGPVLTEWRFVPRIGWYVLIQKQLVLSSTVPADNNAEVYAEGVTVEYEPVTSVYSVKMTTTLPTTGFVWDGTDANDYVYEGTMDYRWPDQLEEKPTIYMLVAGLDNGSLAFDFAVPMNLKEGYAGPCRCVISERYTYDPTDAAFIAGLPAPTLVIPQAQGFITGLVAYTSTNASARFYTWEIPMSLHPEFNYVDSDIVVNGTSLPAYPGSTAFTITPTIEATVPTGFETGDDILRVTKPERVGIGDLWSVLIIRIYHP